MPKVQMPQLGESVAEGTIGKWLKQPGDHVDKYEPIVEVITDKVNAEVPSPFEGTLTEILVQEGETVPNNTDIAVIDAVGEGRRSRGDGRTERPAQETAAPSAREPRARSAPSRPHRPRVPMAPAAARVAPTSALSVLSPAVPPQPPLPLGRCPLWRRHAAAGPAVDQRPCRGQWLQRPDHARGAAPRPRAERRPVARRRQWPQRSRDVVRRPQVRRVGRRPAATSAGSPHRQRRQPPSATSSAAPAAPAPPRHRWPRATRSRKHRRCAAPSRRR